MFNSGLRSELTEVRHSRDELKRQVDAIENAVATIVFSPVGVIKRANKLFRDTVGYSSEQLLGKHHTMLCDASLSNSSVYRSFWADLQNGKSHTGDFARLNAVSVMK